MCILNKFSTSTGPTDHSETDVEVYFQCLADDLDLDSNESELQM